MAINFNQRERLEHRLHQVEESRILVVAGTIGAEISGVLINSDVLIYAGFAAVSACFIGLGALQNSLEDRRDALPQPTPPIVQT